MDPIPLIIAIPILILTALGVFGIYKLLKYLNKKNMTDFEKIIINIIIIGISIWILGAFLIAGILLVIAAFVNG